MTIAIFSLGQLISFNVQTLKDNFESSLAKEDKDISGEVVWKWMTSFLPRLRLGKMELGELCTIFNRHFSSSVGLEEFTYNFNSMSKIDEESLARVTAFNDFLKVNPDVYFLVVSHTNIFHTNYIMQQLEPKIPTCRAGIIDEKMTDLPKVNLLFATSVFSQKEQHTDTLQCAIQQLQISLDQPVVSFLNTIQKVDNACEFEYIPANGMLNANIVMDEVSRVHTQNASSWSLRRP